MAALEVLALNTVIPQIQAPQVGDSYLFPRAAGFSAGTALLPSLAGPSDPDTGMWFPAANTVAWSTGGAERMRISSLGYVGIGTSATPQGVLEVVGTRGNGDILTVRSVATSQYAMGGVSMLNAATSNNKGVSIGTAVRDSDGSDSVFVMFATNSSGQFLSTLANYDLTDNYWLFATAGQERMRITAAGSVGIGTTSPVGLLTVNGFVQFQDSGSFQGFRLQNNADSSLAGNTSYLDTTNNLGTIDANIFFNRATDGSTSIQFGTTPAGSRSSDRRLQRLTITGAGRVGIGNATPGAQLEVFGGNTRDQFRLSHGTGVTYRIGRDTGDGLMYFYGEQAGFNGYVFGGVDGERMRIDSAGNVGIGKTAASGIALDVNGIIHGGERLQLTNGFANVSLRESATGPGYRWALVSGTGTFRLQRSANGLFTDATTPMFFDASNNVGIGTATCSTRLDVRGGDILLSRNGHGVAGMGALYFGHNLNNYIFSGDSNNIMAFAVNDGSEKMRISSAGNVGINETAPDYKLDVNGTFGFTPGASVTPVDNGDVVFEATNNTTLTVKLKGSDGTVRTGTITLA